ncbi:MAG: hypothetical protein U0796_06780 [Gemmatales bacterium]
MPDNPLPLDTRQDIKRDAYGVTGAGIFFAIMGVIGSFGAWFIMLPLLAIVMGISLVVGTSPKRAVYLTLSRAGMVISLIAVVGLAIFAFMFAVCLLDSRGGFH